MVCISYMRIYPRFFPKGCRRQLYNDCGVFTILHTCVLKTTNHLKILREFPRQTKLYRSACLLLSNGTPSKTRLHVFGKSFSPKNAFFQAENLFVPSSRAMYSFFQLFSIIFTQYVKLSKIENPSWVTIYAPYYEQGTSNSIRARWTMKRLPYPYLPWLLHV